MSAAYVQNAVPRFLGRQRGQTDKRDVLVFVDPRPWSHTSALFFGPAGASSLAGASSARYTWDAENRLIRVEPADGVTPTDGMLRVSFRYDYQGRRVRKQVETYQGTYPSGEWTVTAVRKFVWGGTGGSSASGWLMLLELEGGTGVPPVDTVVRKYTWGLDLAGQSGAGGSEPGASATGLLEGAGTIGGLLAIEEPLQIRGVLNYVYFYDGNGNVGQLVDLSAPSAAAAIKAHYEYDPYQSAAELGLGVIFTPPTPGRSRRQRRLCSEDAGDGARHGQPADVRRQGPGDGAGHRAQAGEHHERPAPEPLGQPTEDRVEYDPRRRQQREHQAHRGRSPAQLSAVVVHDGEHGPEH